jgi:choice-of-anchor C domain-containing protein
MSYFISYVTTHKEPRVGDAWAATVDIYYDRKGLATFKSHDRHTFAEAMSFQLFGDPSMRLPWKRESDVNLLVNGSFDEGVALNGSGTVQLKDGSTDIAGWKVNNDVLIMGDGWENAHGSRSILLQGGKQRGGVEQTFETTKGQRYKVTFSLSANPNNGGWPPEMRTTRIEVTAAGTSQTFTFDCTDKTPLDMGWVAKEWEFKAMDAKTTLAFSVVDAKNNAWYGPALDNVRVVVLGGKTTPATKTDSSSNKVTPMAKTDSSSNKEWVELFNGRDLTNWKTHPDKPGKWVVEDGVLVSRGDETSHLFSERGNFENFHLSVEAQINDKGNSGIYFRSEFGLNLVAGGKTGTFPKGYEAQIYTGGGGETQLTGSLYGFAPVKDKLVEPNEWFTMDLIAEGQHITILLNGKKVVDVVDQKRTYTNGNLALQQSGVGTVVRFRKIQIKELPNK